MIWVSYFKESGKFYMDKDFFIPTRFVEDYNKQDEIGESHLATYHFREWLESKIRHESCIAVVMDDGQNNSFEGKILGYPMMVMPRV